jgi:DNA-binding beta-propeller fold protein YncE
MATVVHRPLIAIGYVVAVLLLAFAAGAPAVAQGGGPPAATPSAGPPAVPPEAGPPAGLPSSTPHEVWMLDQGTDLIHVLDERGNEIALIDVTAGTLAAGDFAHTPTGDLVFPHMIEFDSQHRFAFVAATAGAATIVVDAESKEVVEVLNTGPGSHMAAVTPDDSAVWVAVIGTAEMVEIVVDLDAVPPTFEVGAQLEVADLLAPIEAANPTWRPVDEALIDENGAFQYASYSPVCHQYSVGADGTTEAWVTLGPGWAGGGLFVFDIDEPEVTDAVTAAWNPAEVKANCGAVVSPDGKHVVANWSGRVQVGADTDGEWYVFDAASKELLLTESARGLDAHGVRFSPDGRWLWMVNRNSDNGLIVNARNFEVVRDVADVADTPDILDFSPDGRLVYVSQRGPNPRTGAVHAATGSQAGVAVVHAASGRTLRVFEPEPVLDDAGAVQNDIHGLAVRPLGP